MGSLSVVEAVTVDRLVAWLSAFRDAVHEHGAYLTELDSAIGDADHGINMNRGMTAVVGKLDGLADTDIAATMKTIGMTLVSSVGGAGGPLYGTLFLQFGTSTAGKERLELADWAAMIAAGVDGVRARGKAELGDKTMLDALSPARDTLTEAAADGSTLEAALAAAASAAEEGMKATIPLVARKGRASYLGERSAGHQDPGATSSWMLMRTAAETLAEG